MAAYAPTIGLGVPTDNAGEGQDNAGNVNSKKRTRKVVIYVSAAAATAVFVWLLIKWAAKNKNNNNSGGGTVTMQTAAKAVPLKTGGSGTAVDASFSTSSSSTKTPRTGAFAHLLANMVGSATPAAPSDKVPAPTQTPPPTPTPTQPSLRLVVQYVADKQSISVPASDVTVQYSWALPVRNAGLLCFRTRADMQFLQKLRKEVACPIDIEVGSYTASGLSQPTAPFACTAGVWTLDDTGLVNVQLQGTYHDEWEKLLRVGSEARAVFANNILQFLDGNGLDGVVLNYESPGHPQNCTKNVEAYNWMVSAYTSFVVETAAHLATKGKSLSVVVPCNSKILENGFELNALMKAKNVNIIVSAHDMGDPGAGIQLVHTSPADKVGAVLQTMRALCHTSWDSTRVEVKLSIEGVVWCLDVSNYNRMLQMRSTKGVTCTAHYSDMPRRMTPIAARERADPGTVLEMYVPGEGTWTLMLVAGRPVALAHLGMGDAVVFREMVRREKLKGWAVEKYTAEANNVVAALSGRVLPLIPPSPKRGGPSGGLAAPRPTEEKPLQEKRGQGGIAAPVPNTQTRQPQPSPVQTAKPTANTPSTTATPSSSPTPTPPPPAMPDERAQNAAGVRGGLRSTATSAAAIGPGRQSPLPAPSTQQNVRK